MEAELFTSCCRVKFSRDSRMVTSFCISSWYPANSSELHSWTSELVRYATMARRAGRHSFSWCQAHSSNFTRLVGLFTPTGHKILRSRINTLRPREICRHFAYNIFKCFIEWKCMNFAWDFTEVCSKVQINNIPALVQIMTWRWPGDKPLSEPVMVSLLVHICITGPQWVNTLRSEQSSRRFADNIFQYIFLNENYRILIPNPLRSIPSGTIVIIGSGDGSAQSRRQAINWANDDPVHGPVSI